MLELKELLKMDIEEIISSVHSLTLLKYYSKIYVNGGEPRTCERSLRKYYKELKKNYKMDKMKINRVCVPIFEGIRYIPGVHDKDGKLIAGHLHINGSLLTDEQATEFLKLGILSEADFKKLPYEKTEVKKKDKKTMLLEVIERGEFNELSKVGKELGLFEKRGKKEDMLEALENYVSELD